MTQGIQQIESKSNVVSEGFAKQSQDQAAQIALIREQNKKLHEVVTELNQMMGMSSTKLSFSVDRESNKMIVRVVDAETQEVIRQIPSEDAINVSQHIHGLMGILYDASA